MIKKTVKWIFLIGPLILCIIIVGGWVFQWKKINKNFTDADGTEVNLGLLRISVHVQQIKTGEKTQYTISMDTPENGINREWIFVVDRDMFGGGLVAAIDLEKDGSNEIIAWGMHEEKQSFFIDTATGKIEVKPYEQLPTDFKILLHKWHQIHIIKPMELLLLAVLLIFYYLVVGMITTLIWFLKRLQNKSRTRHIGYANDREPA